MKNFILTFVFFLLPLTVHGQSLESIYTDLSGKSCKTIKVEKETGDTTQACPGVGGYRLQIFDGDLRQSITVIDPSGGDHHLQYYSVISSAFSSVGPKAEWRGEKKNGKFIPTALIVRLNASENPDNPQQKTSYLAVAKITPTEICVTDKILPSKDMNTVAQRAADQAGQKPCLKGAN